MGRIRILQETVANQIAAGEVVERPASVVKELVENALDSGASRIRVEIEGGGADRIRISDDGSGMEREDSKLAFERHATSKIRSAADLAAIHTFGFRGEALPSIASVSNTTLTTATGSADGGWRVRVHRGRLVDVEPASHPRGTTVEVENLFRNAPARRKFLRTAATETAQIADRVTRIAAAHPAAAFVLASGGRELLNWPAVSSVHERLAQIVGEAVSGALVTVEHRSGRMRASGLASVPSLHRPTARDQNLYVNARPVRDRRLLHAIGQAYASLLPRGRYPLIFLFLEIPAEEVDINVHPAKSEVRFLRAGAVHDLVCEGIRAALGSPTEPRGTQLVAATIREPPPVGPSWVSPIRGSEGSGPAGRPAASDSPPAVEGLETPGLFDRATFDTLAQYRDSYILASAPDGLVIVDQHAAHERILYERLLDQCRQSRVERQRLLFPATVEVSAAQAGSFEAAAETFAALGFSLGPFGPNTIKVDEIPAITSRVDVDRLMRELLDEVLEWQKVEGLDKLKHRIVASAACHAAVRANHALATEEMTRILVDLTRTEHPMTCPHGRPSVLRMSLKRLEREFGRRS
jgi:DNA mismatch repair protein MutL